MRLEGARVLLTGATGGIGRALAHELAQRKSELLLCARSSDALESLVSELHVKGATAEECSIDLQTSPERAYLARYAEAWRGGVNVVLHCAGVSSFGCLEDLTASSISQLFQVNVVAPILLTHEMLPGLTRQPEAMVVCVGSILGHIGHPGFAVYGATKAALASFAEAMQRECADTSVSFCYVAPRATETSFNSDAVVEMNRELRVGADRPQDVAKQIVAAMERGKPRTYLGWPERLFVRVNALLPGLVDGDMRKKLSVIRRFAVRKTPVDC